MTAMDNLASGLGVMFFLPLLVLGVAKAAEMVRDRSASRRRLAAMPTLAPEDLSAGLDRLRAQVLIPAQRAGE